MTVPRQPSEVPVSSHSVSSRAVNSRLCIIPDDPFSYCASTQLARPKLAMRIVLQHYHCSLVRVAKACRSLCAHNAEPTLDQLKLNVDRSRRWIWKASSGGGSESSFIRSHVEPDFRFELQLLSSAALRIPDHPTYSTLTSATPKSSQ